MAPDTAFLERATVKVAPDVLLAEMTRHLASFNSWRLLPGWEPSSDPPSSADDETVMLRMELAFVEAELSRVQTLADKAPKTADAFLGWFGELEAQERGRHDPLLDWLANTASKDEILWFLSQEIAIEAGFEDLVALTQVKMPPRAKLELARNYWDEMGHGRASAMHGPMLTRLALELGIAPVRDGNDVVWEALALSNLMTGLAIHRRHAYRSVGALGVLELTAPARARSVSEGLRRLGIAGDTRRYYALHATLDTRHSVTWNREIIGPLVASDARLAQPIAEGALARLAARARCFDRYGEILGRPVS